MLCRRLVLRGCAGVASCPLAPCLVLRRHLTIDGAVPPAPPTAAASPSPKDTEGGTVLSKEDAHVSQPADLLFDVLGSAAVDPPRPFTDGVGGRGRSDGGRGTPHTTPASADGSLPWSQYIQQVVREAVLDPLREDVADGAARPPPSSPADPLSSPSSAYKVMVVDALGMPATLPKEAPRSFNDLLDLSPEILRRQLQQLIERRQYHTLTPVQAAAIPLMLEYRDVLCIAPTATGKTLCYVYASLLRLLLNDMNGRSTTGSSGSGTDGEGSNLNRRQVETFLRDKMDRGEVCPYCELSVAEARVCPMTGFPHAAQSDVEADAELRSQERRAMRLEELRASVAEPRVLVLVPNSELVHQVYKVYRSLHCDYRIHYMVRASSPEEQRKYLQALENGVDVLVCAPETILPALFKHKLSLKRVQTVVMDEVDDIVSVNHFEPLKIILGALPKGVQRPQRLLLGASLPPVAYEMIKSRMLLPSHRFVLVDLKAPATAATTALASPTGGAAPTVDGILTSRANLRHLVFLLGRSEKAQKLAWLYATGKLTTDQRTLIFCNSRHNVAYVHDKLKELVPQLHVTTLTSHASATAREGVLKMFRSGVSTCLVCTDLLSRGIDFQNVVYVVHYDMPSDMETWMHRCGRCGRGGGALSGQGYVYTFFQPENVRLAKPLVAHLRQQRQLVPPKLQEYAKQSFIDVFNNSLFHHPTRPYRKDDPQNSTSVLGRGSRRFPDYKQGALHKHFRPQ